MNSVHLKFVLEAERKQRDYADQRARHTTRQLALFKDWQREVHRTRAQLLGLLSLRSQKRDTAI